MIDLPEDLIESLVEAQVPIQPIRINPDADKLLDIRLRITLISGLERDLRTRFKVYVYNEDSIYKDIHNKISSSPYLYSYNGATMYKMEYVVSVEILTVEELK